MTGAGWLLQLRLAREDTVGLDIHNADRVLAEYQDIKAGDVVPLAPNGFGLPVDFVAPEETLVLYGDARKGTGEVQMLLRPGDYLSSTWGFYLFERVDGATRLLERWRADGVSSVPNTILYRAFLKERKMLLGIKERSERLAGSGRGASQATEGPCACDTGPHATVAWGL
jgi:hypothetical protein